MIFVRRDIDQRASYTIALLYGVRSPGYSNHKGVERTSSRYD